MRAFVKLSLSALIAALSASAFAGFSDGLDLSALNDMLKIDASIDVISVYANGERRGQIWTPADITPQKDAEGNLTGEVTYNGGGMTEGINSAKGYISFGQYDDEASLNAFFMRDDFLNARGDIIYQIDKLRECYMDAEDKNAALIEGVIDQVADNVERYLINEGSGGKSAASSRMLAAYSKFYNSYEKNANSVEQRKKALISKLDSSRRSASKKNKQIILEAELRSMINNFNNMISLENEVSSLYSKFVNLQVSYMNSMNTLGAYLGSTNAMAFLSRRRDFSKLTKHDFDRWYGFSNPEKIKGNESYYDDFNVGGRDYYTVFHNFQSGYFTQSMTIDSLAKLMRHYGMDSVRMNDFRGFYEYADESNVTNWYANRMTAPANWADGSSVQVVNGKFTAFNPVWVWNGSAFDHKVIQIGYSIKGDDQILVDSGATGDGKYYVEYDFTEKTATLKKNSTEVPETDTSAVRMWVGTVSNSVRTAGIYTTPLVYMWSY